MFKPAKERLLVKQTKAETQSEGGILLPEGAKERPAQGEVIAVGTCVAYHKGDVVLYGKYSGSPVQIKGEEYLILMAEDVFGALEE